MAFKDVIHYVIIQDGITLTVFCQVSLVYRVQMVNLEVLDQRDGKEKMDHQRVLEKTV